MPVDWAIISFETNDRKQRPQGRDDEITDEIFGGIHAGNADRLLAGGLKGIPRLVVPGGLDIITLRELETVPEISTDRAVLVTESYRGAAGQSAVLRRARSLAARHRYRW